MNITDTGLDNLRLAIVQQAADDYLEHKKYLYRLRNSTSDYSALVKRSLSGKIGALIKWFHGDYYKSLCSIDGDYMIEQLNKKFEDWVNSPDSKKKKTYRKKKVIVA